ncbi:hypothetical protein D9M69_485000 [compost metagenome]
MHGLVQVVGFHMMADDQLAAPARVAAGQIRLAVAIGVEQLGDLRLLQVGDVLDVVGIGSLFVDQVSLEYPGHDVTGLYHDLVTAGLLVELVVQLVPQVHGEIGVAIGQGHHHHAVLGLFRFLDLVAQFAQAFHRHLATEALLGDGGEDRRDLDTLAGLVGRGAGAEGGDCQAQRSSALQEAAGKLGSMHRLVPFFCFMSG